MHNAAFLQNLHRLFTDEGFARSILSVVGVATVLAFGFGATSDNFASILIFGFITAFIEQKLRPKK